MKLFPQSALAFCHYDAATINRNNNRPMEVGFSSASSVKGLTISHHHVQRRRQRQKQQQLLYFHHNIIQVGKGFREHRYNQKILLTSRHSSSFDSEEPSSDRPKKNESEKEDSKRILGREGDIEDVDGDDFLNFDDEALLEELMIFSGELDTGAMDLDDELEELERLIDEQAQQKIQPHYKNDYDSDMFGMGGNEMGAKIPTDIPISSTSSSTPSSPLEQALLQGVVPASAGVGSKCLPGDYGFDPLDVSTKDYFKQVQNFLLSLLPSKDDEDSETLGSSIDGGADAGAALPLITIPYSDSERPPALILRDYREAEIRHGRLAMLAAILWPLQEIFDRLFIPETFGKTTFVYGGTTLPFISLFMTLIMLLLGYLDIYAASIKDNESGDAFLPGECFWDPLRMLDGAPDSMKRRMQERELNNGRMAMVAVFSYIIQEAITHQPVISLPWNEFLFEPAFEIPAVQAWLDGQFGGVSISDVGVENMDLSIDGTWDVTSAGPIDGKVQIDSLDFSEIREEEILLD